MSAACVLALVLGVTAIVLSVLSVISVTIARRNYRKAELDLIEAHANECGK